MEMLKSTKAKAEEEGDLDLERFGFCYNHLTAIGSLGALKKTVDVVNMHLRHAF